MGQWDTCERCGHTSKVSGGEAKGMQVLTDYSYFALPQERIVCDKCAKDIADPLDRGTAVGGGRVGVVKGGLGGDKTKFDEYRRVASARRDRY